MNAQHQPLVSIVTPVYNGEAYLNECIESVLSQTFQNWEYIILNNNSTDRTLEIAEQYQKRDSRIRIYSNDTLLPIIANHNKAFGLISAESKYCKVLSADDWLFPECLERMVGLAEENPSVGIVGAYQLSGGDGHMVRAQQRPTVFANRRVGTGGLPRPHAGNAEGAGNPTSVMYRADLVRNTDRFFPNPTAEADTSACLKHLRFRISDSCIRCCRTSASTMCG